MTSDFIVRREDLGELLIVGSGGTGKIYRVPNFTLPGIAAVAYKEYRPKIYGDGTGAAIEALARLVRFHEELPAELRSIWDSRVIWPLRVVTNDFGDAIGHLMALIPAKFMHQMNLRQGSKRFVRSIEILFGDDADLRRIGVESVPLESRLRLLSHIAGTYAVMHRQGVVIGDISGRNILYDLSPGELATLVIDTDGVRITGSRSALENQPQTPYWEPPEFLHALGSPEQLTASLVQSQRTDVYKFALLVLRILDSGRGKAVNRQPIGATRVLEDAGLPDTAALLARSLVESPNVRPTMRQWRSALRNQETNSED